MAEQTIAPITDEELERFIKGEPPLAPEGSIQRQEVFPSEQQQYRETDIEEKVFSGKTLTKEEILLLEEYGSPLAKGFQTGKYVAGEFLTKVAPDIAMGLAAMGISAYGTLLGSQVGLGIARGRMLGRMGQGIARTVGAMSGAAGASEVNQALGLENDSNWNTGAAALLVAAGYFGARIPKAIMKGSVAGRIIRGMETEEIVRRMPLSAVREQVERTLGQALPGLTSAGLQNRVNFMYDRLRGMGSGPFVDLQTWGRSVRNLSATTANRIYGQLARANPGLAARWRFMRRNTRFGNTSSPLGLYNVSAPELVDLHQYLTNLRDSWMRSGGAARVANRVHAFRLDNLIADLDASLGVQAQMGNVLAMEYTQAARVARLNFARQGIATQLERLSQSIGSRGNYGREINIGRFHQAVNRAREMNRVGRPHPLGTFARMMDEQPGAWGQFNRDLQRLEQLAPEGNVQFFGNTFGFLTRGAAIGAEITGINAMSELLMTQPGRAFMINFMEVNGPTFFPSVLAPALAGIRSSMFSSVEQVEMNAIQPVLQLGDFIRKQTLGRMGYEVAPWANPPEPQQQLQLPPGQQWQGPPAPTQLPAQPFP